MKNKQDFINEGYKIEEKQTNITSYSEIDLGDIWEDEPIPVGDIEYDYGDYVSTTYVLLQDGLFIIERDMDDIRNYISNLGFDLSTFNTETKQLYRFYDSDDELITTLRLNEQEMLAKADQLETEYVRAWKSSEDGIETFGNEKGEWENVNG